MSTDLCGNEPMMWSMGGQLRQKQIRQKQIRQNYSVNESKDVIFVEDCAAYIE